MAKRLHYDFYSKNALEAAPLLLGKILAKRQDSGGILRLRITETEAYCGEEDTACHAKAGKTARTAVMYEKGGLAYIYLCYGIHHLLNVVTGSEGEPQAILIRGVEGFDGPAKLTKALGIDQSLNGENLIFSKNLWIEDDGFVPKHHTAARVGIDYANEQYKNALWRFIAY